MSDKRKTGTREWAPATINVASGCSHGCLYCYGRADRLRYGQIRRGEDWTAERVIDKRVAKGYRGGRGRVMMPSSHDITPGTVEAVGTVAIKLLGAKTPLGKPPTRLLLVTKGDGPCVQRICERLDALWRHRVVWRLTIGCLDDRCRAFWEPHAPPIEMRLEVLRQLHREGWQTSASCEPLLQPSGALALVTRLAPHVTDTIWIGTCRELRARTAWCRRRMGERLERAIGNLEAWQTPDAILGVATVLRDNLAAEAWEKVRFKDSYSTVLEAAGWRIEAGRVVSGSEA